MNDWPGKDWPDDWYEKHEEDTIKTRVAVTPTLLIPAYRVKRKKSHKHKAGWFVSGLLTVIIIVLMLAVIIILVLMAVGVIMSVTPGG